MISGVITIIKSKYHEAEPVIQFLDTKRFPIQDREAPMLVDILAKCRLRPPQLIITTDDPAFDFVRKYRAELGADIPVIFGGVNRFVPEMIAGQPNITGVSEETDFQGTFALISSLTPESKKILVINNHTESGQASRHALENNLTAAQSRYKFEYYEDWTNEQLIERVSSLPDDTVGLILDSTQDATGRFNYHDLAFTTAISTRSRRPLFVNSRPPGNNDWSASPWLGVGGGMVVAGVHGEKVGELALRVLGGQRADAIPVVRRSPTVMEVDYRQIQRLGLSLSRLPPGTRVTNAPVTFYQVNRSRIIGVAIVFVFLCGVIFSMSLNILKRRLAEKALREAQSEIELLATAMAQASDIILVIGADARVRYANTAFARITERSAADVRLQDFDDLWSLPGANPCFSRLRPIIDEHGLWSGNFDLQKESGHTARLKVSISPLRTDRGEISHFLFMARDITPEIKLEEQLRSSQKMEAIGMLAGGIAHDFNNILQVIRCQCGLLTDDKATMAEIAEGLTIIGTATDRASQLTRQLLLFSSKQPINLQPIDPNALITNLLKMLRRLIGEHIEVKFVPLPGSVSLLVDSGQLEQVFLNLCVNARDAMPSGGRLLIEMSRAQPESVAASARPDLAPGEYLRIKVSDTGCGMPPEVVARVFEPFFTTKPVGQGTGLGLSVVYGIVHQHRGVIHVQSTPGTGTVFELLLPMLNANAVAIPSGQPPVVPPGHGMILLAEDDLQIQTIASRVLSRNGFEVVTASDGALAIALCDQHHANLRLVILDVIMPTVSGRGVYDHLKRHYPGIPVLFCSGYSAEMLPPEMAPEAGLALLSKPYTVAELLEAVDRLLRFGT